MAASTDAISRLSEKSASNSEACTSILDNDLYKFTMQQAVRQHYSNTPCDYRFTNRSPELAQLPLKAIPWLKSKVQDMAQLRLTDDERSFLESKCPYLTQDYLDWLQNEFRFQPEQQIKIDVHNDDSSSTEPVINVTIQGDWHQVILYEVPLLALISEAYFRFGDQDWDYEGQFEAAKVKAERLIEAGAKFAEFGTRRRRDYETHRRVLEGLMAGSHPSTTTTTLTTQTTAAHGQGCLTGTSNLHFAHVFNLTPIGTMAHEWFMGIAAILKDASRANQVALERWAETYPGQVLSIALTDTFTTSVFLKTFQGELARDWMGVRHDSGDAFEFMKQIVKHYDLDALVGPELRKNKKIVFSDGLNVDLAIQLQEAADQQGIQASFGIGTHFTNDYRHKCQEGGKSVAMNIVIKLHSCAGKECVKLSDDRGKESGSAALVNEVKRQIGIAL
ncbi:nicotinate phosphoribosyltransferase [Mortierella claussenii]|nr:nicotinate phosphoribosyltransferase [Mortierella claussenii]